MATNIKVAGGLVPGVVNTPLDARSRVATEEDIWNIENPALGGLVFCTGTGKLYIITALKSKQIGALEVENAAVAKYQTFSISLTARADLEFTSASLSENVLTVSNATIAGLVVLDADGMQQLPEITQSGTSVLIDFTGWTVSGTWRVQFSNILAPSDTPDLSNYYTKTEIDAKFGTFEAAATAVIGEA